MQESVLVAFITFAVSLYGLMRGADFLIDGSGDLARKANVSELFIGLTIIALGTSLPELVVSVRSALTGNVGLAYSNVIGSDLTNILLVLGSCAVVCPLSSSKGVRNDIPFLMALVLVLTVSVFSTVDFKLAPLSASLSNISGSILILFFLAFIYRTYKNRNLHLDDVEPSHIVHTTDEINISKTIALIVVGLVLLIAGGDYAVSSAVEIAQLLGISETTIGLTIVALGTSLPELVACLTAAYKGKGDMAIGNILGSNFMNISLVLGVSSFLNEISIDFNGLIDLVVHLFVSILFCIVMLRKKQPVIGKAIGSLFVGLYVVYMVYVGTRS